MSFNRRFRNGLSFGFNDTIGSVDRPAARRARLQHNADGTFSIAPDQAQADELLGNNIPRRTTSRATSCGICPTSTRRDGALKALGVLVNDWQLSGRVDRGDRRALHGRHSATRTAAAT